MTALSATFQGVSSSTLPLGHSGSFSLIVLMPSVCRMPWSHAGSLHEYEQIHSLQQGLSWREARVRVNLNQTESCNGGHVGQARQGRSRLLEGWVPD